MLYYAKGSSETVLASEDIQAGVVSALDQLGKRNKVLVLPPDFTRYHSGAGRITSYIWSYYGSALTDILPALGTHAPMTDEEIRKMFPRVPRDLFRVHNWRKDLETLGTVPASFVRKVSAGIIDYSWPAQVNPLVSGGGHDVILSVGQVVPHEVVGMANHNKNIFIGTGGTDGINKSHFLGAAYGMERLMGKTETPVRKVLNYASAHFSSHLPIVYILTVVAPDSSGRLVCRGLFIGDGFECFEKAAALSLDVNFTVEREPVKKAVIYLDPEEYKSTWLGNKAIYRTRMLIADRGELVILAPGVRDFGEDPEIDKIIRKYGYLGSKKILSLAKSEKELSENLSAAAHLIHGSSEGRFTITYCPGGLSRQEIKSVNFNYASLEEMEKKYNPKALKEGWNTLSRGEKVYFISNPAVGLWADKHRIYDL